MADIKTILNLNTDSVNADFFKFPSPMKYIVHSRIGNQNVR